MQSTTKAYLAKGKVTMSVLAIGGEAAFGTMMATVMRFGATDVQEAIVPDSGHWIMGESLSDDQTRYRRPKANSNRLVTTAAWSPAGVPLPSTSFGMAQLACVLVLQRHI
jgi:hypothetical protein